MTVPCAVPAAAAALSIIAICATAQPAPTTPRDAFEQSHRTSVEANPTATSLTIRTAGDRQQFAMGEVVTLELTFANDGGGAYTFNPIGYDRSGRLGIDRVHVSPQDQTSDPLRDYYRGMLFGFIGGGASAVPSLLRDPRTVELRVNEWVRFERPGEYRLFVESGRLENDALSRDDPARRVRLVSNMISIRIVACDETAGKPDLVDWPVGRLRFADTQAAAREMARRLLHSVEVETRVGSDLVELRHGLLATPHRRVALDALEHALDTQRGLVNPHVVEIAAFLSVMVEQPRQSIDPETQLEDGSVIKRRFDTYRCRVTMYRGRALAAGVRGSPEEQARALVTFGGGEPPGDCEQPAGMMAQPRRAEQTCAVFCPTSFIT